ncbi:MAG: hypothetical protein AUG51_10010 [Acidobacteria bacterium 13_1_20CM_3_53_8]|nr:MAG: hypothetical protein AUG51_10010 [Acidobacteria bacterium 13_1_20CM_3_53_8]
MDEIAKKMAEIEWIYADKDPQALSILEEKIAGTGRKLGLITYSKLVEGVDFHLPNIRKGEAYSIQTYNWTGLDRAILGEFLGYTSTRSYREAGFMASALVVNSTGYEPSNQFFEWMEKLGVLPDNNKDTILAFWADQVHKAQNWYKAGRR